MMLLRSIWPWVVLTNTVLHTLAIAREAGIDYDLKDINEIAKKTPYLSKIAPSSVYTMHDVHEAGGVPAIINQLIKKVPLRVIVLQLLVKP